MTGFKQVLKADYMTKVYLILRNSLIMIDIEKATDQTSMADIKTPTNITQLWYIIKNQLLLKMDI